MHIDNSKCRLVQDPISFYSYKTVLIDYRIEVIVKKTYHISIKNCKQQHNTITFIFTNIYHINRSFRHNRKLLLALSQFHFRVITKLSNTFNLLNLFLISILETKKNLNTNFETGTLKLLTQRSNKHTCRLKYSALCCQCVPVDGVVSHVFECSNFVYADVNIGII